jgi:periplasmic protein TonB
MRGLKCSGLTGFSHKRFLFAQHYPRRFDKIKLTNYTLRMQLNPLFHTYKNISFLPRIVWKNICRLLLVSKLIIMENNKILSAAFIDILFDGRNKEYGAYQLRKSYNKRVATALVVTGSFILLLFLGSALANALDKKNNSLLPVEQIVELTEVDQPKKIEPPVVQPPKQLTEPPKVKMEQFTPPEIKPDNEVKPDEQPPLVDDLANAVISTIKQDGIDADNTIIAPPVEGSGNVVAPKADLQDYDITFTKVEDPATFPGGMDGWRRHLERNLHYPEAAIDNETQGVVKVQMVVDKFGKITEVVALNDPGNGLAEEAVRVIKQGPNWVPAEQNGVKVAYRFVQAITFQM